MALFNIFKKRRKGEEKKSFLAKVSREKRKKTDAEKTPKDEVEVKSKKEKPVEGKFKPGAAKPKTKISDVAYRVLKEPHITEKATALTKKNQYIFKVWPRSNKIEIKKAIENLYGVEVISVKIIKIPRRQRRLGRTFGWKKGYKKAIIKIREGQKIEVLPR